MSCVKFLAKFQNLNFSQLFQICNFHFVFFWFGIWWESLVWVIMGQLGVSQNAVILVFSCDQAALQMVFSVCLSVRPSVRLFVRPSVTPFWLCSHHRIIMKFSRVITSDRSDVHAKGQGQRSKVKVTEVTTQLYCFWTVTPVWIHVWWWNDAIAW